MVEKILRRFEQNFENNWCHDAFGIFKNICGVHGATNTTHYLHPVNQYINETLKRGTQEFHDSLLQFAYSSTYAQFKLMKAIYRYAKIRESYMAKFSDKTSMYRISYRFVSITETLWAGRNRINDDEWVELIDLTAAVRVPHESVVAMIGIIIIDEETSDAEKVRKATILASNSKFANNVLQNAGAIESRPLQKHDPDIIGLNFCISVQNAKIEQTVIYLSNKEVAEAMELKENWFKKDEISKRQRRNRLLNALARDWLVIVNGKIEYTV